MRKSIETLTLKVHYPLSWGSLPDRMQSIPTWGLLSCHVMPILAFSIYTWSYCTFENPLPVSSLYTTVAHYLTSWYHNPFNKGNIILTSSFSKALLNMKTDAMIMKLLWIWALPSNWNTIFCPAVAIALTVAKRQIAQEPREKSPRKLLVDKALLVLLQEQYFFI